MVSSGSSGEKSSSVNHPGLSTSRWAWAPSQPYVLREFGSKGYRIGPAEGWLRVCAKLRSRTRHPRRTDILDTSVLRLSRASPCAEDVRYLFNYAAWPAWIATSERVSGFPPPSSARTNAPVWNIERSCERMNTVALGTKTRSDRRQQLWDCCWAGFPIGGKPRSKTRGLRTYAGPGGSQSMDEKIVRLPIRGGKRSCESCAFVEVDVLLASGEPELCRRTR